jgi:hypothetical protein
VAAVKPIEESLAAAFRNANAEIPDAQANGLTLFRERDVDSTAIRAVLDGVVEQVRQHLLDAIGVDVGLQVIWRLHDNRMPASRQLARANDVLDQPCQISRLSSNAQSGGIDSRGVEQMLDEASQTLRLFVKALERSPQLVGLERPLSIQLAMQ